MQVFLT